MFYCVLKNKRITYTSHLIFAAQSRYQQFVSAELGEILANPTGQYSPYGTGTTTNSPIIALGEAWGFYMGHFLADQHNWVNAYNQSEQIETNGYGIYCSATTGTGPPDIEVLEYFTPGFLNDPFHWIPKGLMYDLMDNGEPPQTNFNDQVSGFTIAQIFSALQSDFNPISQYKARILLQNNNSQQTQINNLFTSYGY